MKTFISVLWIALLSIFDCFGQTHRKADTLQANVHYNIADSLQRAAHYKESLPYFLKASEIFKNVGWWQKYFESLERTSESYWRIREFEKAQERLELLLKDIKTINDTSGLNINIQKAAAFYNLGIVNSKQLNYRKALNYEYKALSIYKDELGVKSKDVGHISNSIANIYDKIGEYDSALIFYNNAIAIYNNLGSNEQVNVANTYYNISLIYFHMGSYDHAIIALENALNTYKAKFGPKHPSLAYAFNGIGHIHMQLGSGKLAIQYFERALEINKAWYGEVTLKTGDDLTSLGMVYNLDGQYEKALTYFNTALEIRTELLSESDPKIADVLLEIGLVYLNTEQYELAIDFYNKALYLTQTHFENNHPKISIIYNRMADVYKHSNDFDTAKKYYKEAMKYEDVFPAMLNASTSLATISYKQKKYEESLLNYHNSMLLNSNEFNDSSVYANPEVSKSIEALPMLESLIGKALSFEQLFNSKQEEAYLHNALKTLQTCDTLVDEIRKSYVNFEDKVELNSSTRKVYEAAIRVSNKLYEGSRKSDFLNRAYYFLEKSKKTILSESIGSISAKQLGLIPDSLHAYEQELKGSKSFYQSKIEALQKEEGEKNSIQLKDYQLKLFEINRKYDSLVLVFEQNYPKYHQLKYDNTPLGLDELQKEMNDGSALIEYFVGDTSVYVFMVTKKQAELINLENYQSILNNIEKLKIITENWAKGDLTDDLFLQFVSNSNELYQDLLLQVLNQIRGVQSLDRLIIIPDNQLSYLPFELFLTDTSYTTIGDYSSLNYIIKDYTISYAHSNTIKSRYKPVINQTTSSGFLGYAPIYEAENGNFNQFDVPEKFRNTTGALEWNQDEVLQASNKMDGMFRIGAEANESNFRNEAPNYKVLHLAMHALIDDEDPMRSKLVFNTDHTDTINDGYLHTYEIFNMEITPELVVLSACNTGVGKFMKGEGTASLAYAFSYAGCPSVVMSKWAVDDESTSVLMNHFYENLSKGMNTDEALRLSKLEFLKDPSSRFSNPLYWAGFVMVGETNSLTINDSNSIYLLVCSLVGLVLIVTLIFWIRRTNRVRSAVA